MNQPVTPPWREVVREQTSAPPPGARQRVWSRLDPTREPPRALSPRLAWAGSALAAVTIIALWLHPAPPPGPQVWRTDGAVISLTHGHATWDPAKHLLSLTDGEVAVSVWGAPALSLQLGARRVDVRAASLVARVAAESIVVLPVDGSVSFDGQVLESTAATRAAAGSLLAGLEPADVATRRAALQASSAVEAGRWQEAVTALDQVAHSGSLGAEAALLQKGELELRELKDPRRAQATFLEAQQRFPTGNLAQERELSLLEAEFLLHEWRSVADRAARFVSAFPNSERLVEVRRLRVDALVNAHELGEACAEVRNLPGTLSAGWAASCPH